MLPFGPILGVHGSRPSGDLHTVRLDGDDRGSGGRRGASQNDLASILATARVLVGFTGGVLSVHQADRRLWDILDLQQIAPDAVQAVLAFDAENDPAAVLHDSPECRVVLGRMEVPLGGEGGSAANLLSGGSVFQIVLDRDDGRTWLLTLVRDRTLGPFTAREVTMLSSVVPAFRAVLRQERGFDRLAEMSSITTELLDCLAFGVLLVDADRRVLWSNATARAILASSGALQVVGQRLQATDARCNLRMREILHELAGAASSAGRALSLYGADGPSIQLGFVRLREAETSAVTAVFLSSSDSADISARFLRDLYGLTPVEAEIARLICRGSAPAATADHLRLSIHTVRDYLKPIFQKMGVRRQADMVRVAATFANVFNGCRRQPPAGACAQAREWN